MNNDFAKLMGLGNIEALNTSARRKRMKEGIGCPLCDYSEYTVSENGKAVMCSCAKNKYYQEIFIKADVPRAYIHKTLDDWNTHSDSKGNSLGNQQSTSVKILSLLKFYEKKLPKICGYENISFVHTGSIRAKLHSINFEGSFGSGKTFLAAVMVQSSIKQGYPAKYYDWSEIFSCCSDYNKKSELDEIVEEFKNLEFIAIDGIEHYNLNNALTSQNIDRLCKARLNSGKPYMLFSFGNISQIQGCSGWTSLVNNCLLIRLPQPK